MEIFELKVGGGILALSPLPGASGDLRADVAQIAKWGARLVVSVTEVEEMARLGATQLPEALAQEGITWCHFPIRDFDVPVESASQNWENVSADVRRYLAQGQRVLVHCRGGCGRSGMVVLRVMGEAGEMPSDALARLREARACAVETDAQMVWATKGALSRM